MKIKDKNGKERNLRVDYFRGTAIVISDADTFEPLGSSIIQDTGEISATMRNPDFRGNKEFTDYGNSGIRSAILLGFVPATSGYLFSFMSPEHGNNKNIPQSGAELTRVEINGKEFNRWAIPLTKVLSGK